VIDVNLDERIARTKDLIARREDIDTELSRLLGVTSRPKRGRPIRQDTSVGTDHGGGLEPPTDSAK
jgi:hypothetical protein